ncbi:DUF3429 domain-containing protein [Azotobacter salinestris]|uniref:DUF3429 domain-containing protein n=1 Tax=Azotobacter salinestris TaxID=69964 RepID=UPI0032DF8785
MPLNHDSHPPYLSRLLGFVGLLPFVIGALALWFIPTNWKSVVLTALLNYAAVVLSFMGAIHWGLAMCAGADRGDRRALAQLGLSVIPPLVGWLAVSFRLSVAVAIPLLLLAFVLLYLADLQAIRLGLAPAWYRPLRKPLTIAATVSLLVAWGGVLFAGQ